MKQRRKDSRKRTIYRVRVFGKRVDITALLRNTLFPALDDYNDTQNALRNGVDPKIVYNIPKSRLYALRRYERALALYDEYKHAHGTPRADKICSAAKPTTPNHLVHFIFKSASNKSDRAYIHYRVVVAKHGKSYGAACDCPDFVNHGGSIPCKHVLFACMLLRDWAVVERR
jgi:hypothetical protein